MTTHWLVAATCLVAAAVVLGWPRRSRQTRLLTSSHPATTSLKGRVESLSGPRAMTLAVALAALTGTLVAGPVAGVVAGGYGAIGVRTVLRRRAARAAAAMRTRSLDALCGLAADLRAGLPASGPDPVGSTASGSTASGSTRDRPSSPEPASLDGLSDPAPGPSAVEDRRMARLAGAAWRLAERTGVPIADLIERIEADARAMDRASAAAAAQAAGARATAWLLAGLPVGGIALGYSIGADPLAVLLHTPIGAACAVGAIVLQVAGLAWADRIASVGTARPEPAPQPADPPTPTPPPLLGTRITPTPAGPPLPPASPGVVSTPAWPPLPAALSGAASTPTWQPLPSALSGAASTPTWQPLPSALSGAASTPTWRPSPPEAPRAAPTTASGEAPVMPLWPTTAPTTASAVSAAGSPWRTVPGRPVPSAASGVAAPQTGTPRPPVAPGQVPAPGVVPKAPLRKAGGTGPSMRSGASPQADSPEEARTAARPKPYPLPRAAANRMGAPVADPPSPGSDA